MTVIFMRFKSDYDTPSPIYEMKSQSWKFKNWHIEQMTVIFMRKSKIWDKPQQLWHRKSTLWHTKLYLED